jgi:hypothetical protein
MSFSRGLDGPDDFRVERDRLGAELEKRATRSTHVATGTLACPDCDAPIALSGPVSPTDTLRCPFCGSDGPVRDFLSLTQPTRPTRVVVRIVMGQPRITRGE